jgi:hypothetical protein
MTIEPNWNAIERHIHLLTKPWIENELSAMLELRCLQHGGGPRCHYVDPTDEDLLEDAITKVFDLNQAGWNAYICVNPICNSHAGPAKDAAILGAYFAFADADDGKASKQLLASSVPPDFYVQTGTIPTQRLHAYWRVDGIPDLDNWRQMQKHLIAKFDSDDAICNPSRIMRLAGTVAYPSVVKKQRGYVPEITLLKEDF